MAIEVVMPRLGWTMEEGSIVEWLKHDGETVAPGDILFTIESDKAVHEVEAMDGGILRIPPDAPPPGAPAPIGALLAYLVAPGEAAPFEPAAAQRRPAETHGELGADAPESASARTGNGAAGEPARLAVGATATVTLGAAVIDHLPTISPRARRVAAELGVDWTRLTGSGRTGRIVERDVRAAAAATTAARREVRVSPLARRMAEATGVDAAELARAHPGARLTSADIAAAQATPPASAVTGTPPHGPLPSGSPVDGGKGTWAPSPSTGRARVGAAPAPSTPLAAEATAGRVGLGAPAATGSPLTGLRRLIAARLSESARTTVPVTLTTEADATRLAALRAEMVADLAASALPAPSYTDLLIRLTAVALLEHPALNASLADGEILHHAVAHIGLAVETPRGLLAPVVRDAHARSVQQLAVESARLIAAARDGSIGPDDLRGGTFTITNLGMYEIDAFTPVINLPECAILGIGRIVARPVVLDEAAGTVGVRKLLALSLTFDHRLVDGAPAARFLQRVKHLIERPMAWLIQ